MLMFAKVLLMSFHYNVVDAFAFRNVHAKKNFTKNDIIKCHLYLLSLDIENASILFTFVCKIHCSTTEPRRREIIFFKF